MEWQFFFSFCSEPIQPDGQPGIERTPSFTALSQEGEV